ncbi:helix-turn-helix domain-containing protein [Rhodospirillaceae bacterium SYSU D60014]|uniref:IclR family transcriptional regulator n=1 Tax=Virgifigura deserti TaxID=2268457 RepID=UPI000E66969C
MAASSTMIPVITRTEHDRMAGSATPAVARIFEILELFESEQRPLSLREIVEWLGYPMSTTSAILKSMAALGYLRHDRSARTYIPTMRLAHLGTWSAAHDLPSETCMSALRQLCAETGELIYLAHRNDIYMQYLHINVGEKYGSPPQRPGATRFLVHTALGWSLMTFLDRRAVNSIIRRTNAILPPPDNCDPGTVLRAIERCREEGYAVSENTIRLGHGVIAAPLAFAHQHYAVGVAAPVERLRQHGPEYASKLLAMVSDVSTL